MAFIAGDKGFLKAHAQADLANQLAEVCRRHDNYLPVLEGLSQKKWGGLTFSKASEGGRLLKRDSTYK